MGRPKTDPRRLHPGFVAAVKASPLPRSEQARLAGFPHMPQLSSVLSAGRVVPSPINLTRLEILGHVLGYSGPVLAEEFTAPSRDAFDAEHLPAPRA